MNPSALSSLRDRPLIIAFLILVGVNLFIGNATTSVWDQDEAAYAGFVRSILADGRWCVPEFPWSQPHRKVPLTFWLMAVSCTAFGINEFALRLPSVLAFGVTIATVWYGGRLLVGRDLARLAAMVLASTLLILNLSKIALTDGVLLAFETIAALALLRGVMRPSWQATVVLWAAVAAGLLTKGPPILILVGGMFLFVLVFHRRRRNLVHLHPWFGLPLALLPLAIWIWLAWQQDQRYVLFLGYWYILRRVGGTTFGQAGPPGTYLALFFVCLIPWTGYLVAVLGDAWRGFRRRRGVLLLIGAWLFGGWVLWELVASKLPTYTLGAYPALALLLARQVQRNTCGCTTWAAQCSLRVGFYILVGGCCVLAAALLGLALWVGAPWAKAAAVVPTAAIVGTALLALRFQRRAAPVASVKTLVLGTLAANLLVWLVIIPGIEPLRSVSPRIARVLARQCGPATTVLAAPKAILSSLPFYIEQAGLQFEDLDGRDADRGPVDVDWSLLWRLRFGDLVQQVKNQNPPELTEDELQRTRLARVTELYRSGQPRAFVLDDEQYAALQPQLPGAGVTLVEGWLSDRLRKATYTVVVSPAALKRASDAAAGVSP